MEPLKTRSCGHCRCGRTTFTVDAPPLLTMACHCDGCRRMTSSAFSLSALYAAPAFRLTAGDPVRCGLNGAFRHYGCRHCMTWLYTFPAGTDDYVNVRAVLLDDPALHRPYIETHTDEKLPWVTTPAVHSFAKLPPQEAFAELVAGCARWLTAAPATEGRAQVDGG